MDAAESMGQILNNLGVTRYKQIVLVGHSMGGLVAMHALTTNPNLRAKVPLTVFFATPMEGAHLANIAALISQDSQYQQIKWADNNIFLHMLLGAWNRMKPRPIVSCGYEDLKTGGIMVVPWTSSTRICTDQPAALKIVGTDHSTIVKPDRAQNLAIVMLTNAVKRFVLDVPDGKLVLPDFEGKAPTYRYTMRTIEEYVAVRNVGGRPISLLSQKTASKVTSDAVAANPSAKRIDAAAFGLTLWRRLRSVQIGDADHDGRAKRYND